MFQPLENTSLHNHRLSWMHPCIVRHQYCMISTECPTVQCLQRCAPEHLPVALWNGGFQLATGVPLLMVGLFHGESQSKMDDDWGYPHDEKLGPWLETLFHPDFGTTYVTCFWNASINRQNQDMGMENDKQKSEHHQPANASISGKKNNGIQQQTSMPLEFLAIAMWKTYVSGSVCSPRD